MKIKSMDIQDEFTEWQGMTCNICGETVANDYGDMKCHLEEAHDLDVED